MIAVSFVIRKNKLPGYNVELLKFKPGGTYSNHWTLNCYYYPGADKSALINFAHILQIMSLSRSVFVPSLQQSSCGGGGVASPYHKKVLIRVFSKQRRFLSASGIFQIAGLSTDFEFF
jgi:hypothetical protein